MSERGGKELTQEPGEYRGHEVWKGTAVQGLTWVGQVEIAFAARDWESRPYRRGEENWRTEMRKLSGKQLHP